MFGLKVFGVFLCLIHLTISFRTKKTDEVNLIVESYMKEVSPLLQKLDRIENCLQNDIGDDKCTCEVERVLNTTLDKLTLTQLDFNRVLPSSSSQRRSTASSDPSFVTDLIGLVLHGLRDQLLLPDFKVLEDDLQTVMRCSISEPTYQCFKKRVLLEMTPTQLCIDEDIDSPCSSINGDEKKVLLSELRFLLLKMRSETVNPFQEIRKLTYSSILTKPKSAKIANTPKYSRNYFRGLPQKPDPRDVELLIARMFKYIPVMFPHLGEEVVYNPIRGKRSKLIESNEKDLEQLGLLVSLYQDQAGALMRGFYEMLMLLLEQLMTDRDANYNLGAISKLLSIEMQLGRVINIVKSFSERLLIQQYSEEEGQITVKEYLTDWFFDVVSEKQLATVGRNNKETDSTPLRLPKTANMEIVVSKVEDQSNGTSMEVLVAVPSSWEQQLLSSKGEKCDTNEEALQYFQKQPFYNKTVLSMLVCHAVKTIYEINLLLKSNYGCVIANNSFPLLISKKFKTLEDLLEICKPVNKTFLKDPVTVQGRMVDSNDVLLIDDLEETLIAKVRKARWLFGSFGPSEDLGTYDDGATQLQTSTTTRTDNAESDLDTMERSRFDSHMNWLSLNESDEKNKTTTMPSNIQELHTTTKVLTYSAEKSLSTENSIQVNYSSINSEESNTTPLIDGYVEERAMFSEERSDFKSDSSLTSSVTYLTNTTLESSDHREVNDSSIPTSVEEKPAVESFPSSVPKLDEALHRVTIPSKTKTESPALNVPSISYTKKEQGGLKAFTSLDTTWSVPVSELYKKSTLDDGSYFSQASNATLSSPSSDDGIPSSPSADDSIPSSPSADDAIPSSPSADDAIPSSPSADDAIPSSPSADDAIPSSPSADHAIPSSPSGDDAIPLSPSGNDVTQSSSLDNIATQDSIPVKNSTPFSTSGDDAISSSLSYNDGTSSSDTDETEGQVITEESKPVDGIASKDEIEEEEENDFGSWFGWFENDKLDEKGESVSVTPKKYHERPTTPTKEITYPVKPYSSTEKSIDSAKESSHSLGEGPVTLDDGYLEGRAKLTESIAVDPKESLQPNEKKLETNTPSNEQPDNARKVTEMQNPDSFRTTSKQKKTKVTFGYQTPDPALLEDGFTLYKKVNPEVALTLATIEPDSENVPEVVKGWFSKEEKLPEEKITIKDVEDDLEVEGRAKKETNTNEKETTEKALPKAEDQGIGTMTLLLVLLGVSLSLIVLILAMKYGSNHCATAHVDREARATNNEMSTYRVTS